LLPCVGTIAGYFEAEAERSANNERLEIDLDARAPIGGSFVVT
jgi:hypothetical protein